MTQTRNTSNLHIVIFASTDSNHLSQLLELAKSITTRGNRVSFVSTISGLKTVKIDPLSPNPSNLDLVPLPGEDTRNLREPFSNFLRQATPDVDWVIFDLSTFWVPQISQKLGINSVYITFNSAISNAFMWRAVSGPDEPNIYQLMPQCHGSSIAYDPGEAYKVLEQLTMCDAQRLPLYCRIRSAITMCDMVALPCYHQLDGKIRVEQMYQKHVLSFGYFPQTATTALSDFSMNSAIVREWLDKRDIHSVVYVAVEATIFVTPLQIAAIADGLERSRIPFVWVTGSPNGGETLNLPIGFEERTRSYGLVCKNWDPHDTILSHPSVGGFLTNGNWISSIQAINSGIPLILAPLSTADVPNVHLLVDKKLGHEVTLNSYFGVFLGDDVDRALKYVMVEERGEEIRESAKAMKGVFGSLQNRYITSFLHGLNEIKKRNRLCDLNGCVICKHRRKIAGPTGVVEYSED